MPGILSKSFSGFGLIVSIFFELRYHERLKNYHERLFYGKVSCCWLNFRAGVVVCLGWEGPTVVFVCGCVFLAGREVIFSPGRARRWFFCVRLFVFGWREVIFPSGRARRGFFVCMCGDFWRVITADNYFRARCFLR